MNKRQIIAVSLCAALAACDGTRFVGRASGYDPQSVPRDGPVDITLVGAPGIERSAIVAAVSDSLRFNGVLAGAVQPPGDFNSGYRVAILYGPAAFDLAAGGDSAANSCRALNGEAGALSAASDMAPPEGDRIPVAALLCHRDQYLAMAYATLRRGEPIVVDLPVMINQLFPAPPISD